VLFLTVCCEFFTEDSGPDSLPALALKTHVAETALVAQLVVSTALAVYSMVMLMLLGSNQQLNGLFLQLQYMTQIVPLPQAQAQAYTTRPDDFALFVRALLGLHVVICGCTGTFQELFFLEGLSSVQKSLKTALGGDKRNYVALVFWAWCLLVDALRAVLPAHWISAVVLGVPDLMHGFVCAVLAEVLFHDRSLTNFACAVLLICDATCVLVASICCIVNEVRIMLTKRKDKANMKATQEARKPAKKTQTELVADLVLATQPKVAPGSQPRPGKNDDDPGLEFSASHVNVDDIIMRVFEKKSN
jgi:hypothetical protein